MKDYILSDEIVFNAKPDAVPYNYRISYKIAQICLVVATCCGRGGCSLVKLHMISAGLSTNLEYIQLREFAYDRLTVYPIVRFDPAVNRAVKYALADNLIVQQQNGLFKLSTKGKQLVTNIRVHSDLMTNEKCSLEELSDKLREDKIKSLMGTWRYFDVEN